MSLAAKRIRRLVREIYEERPYPVTHEGAIKTDRWPLPSMEWIAAVGQDNGSGRISQPRRILVAGCGTGVEAFAMRRRFPKAHITAIDFSQRSIGLAKELQRRFSKSRSIRFVVSDLAEPRLASKVGGDFNFVSCHGVLSYLPRPAAALRNLAECLASDGALYLGVNGSTHHSASLRKVLPGFGVDIRKLEDGPTVRRLLKLCDAIAEGRSLRHSSTLAPVLLAGDVFGPLIHDLSLSVWARMARRAGLWMQASYHHQLALRRLFQRPISQMLMPKSRAEICEVADTLRPTGFHRLLFSRIRPTRPPWKSARGLLQWSACQTGLYQFCLPPKRTHSTRRLRKVIGTSKSIGSQLEWRMPDWEIEILRHNDGRLSLDEILSGSSESVSYPLLRDELYRLYQLDVINLLPPRSARL